jgi:hypothetical protein
LVLKILHQPSAVEFLLGRVPLFLFLRESGLWHSCASRASRRRLVRSWSMRMLS